MRKFILFILIFFPSSIKIYFYRRLFGFKIGKSVSIGLTFLCCGQVKIGDGVKIGHFNVIFNVKKIALGKDVKVGHFNILINGDEVSLGDGVLIDRFNEINAIRDALCLNEFHSQLVLGDRVVVTAWHKIDYTDRVEIGENSIIAGRGSCLWTHNRQLTKPLRIGRNNYICSGVQFTPGSTLGDFNIIALGAVVAGSLEGTYSIYGGVPAKFVKIIDQANRILVEFSTRPDLD